MTTRLTTDRGMSERHYKTTDQWTKNLEEAGSHKSANTYPHPLLPQGTNTWDRPNNWTCVQFHFDDSRFSRFVGMTSGVEIQNGSCDHDTPFLGMVWHSWASTSLDIAYTFAKYDNFSFSRSKDMIRAPQNLHIVYHVT